MFVFFLIIIIIICLYFFNKYEKFKQIKYSYEPELDTPQTNYNKIISKINSNQSYKLNTSVALSPTPTIHCPELKTKNKCNDYGCNWFGTFCSSTYPTQI